MRAGIASVGDGSTHSDRDEYEYEIYMSREEKNEKNKKNEYVEEMKRKQEEDNYQIGLLTAVICDCYL